MIITRTPLRISFFGGGSDFKSFYEKYGGAVLSTTINKYIYVIVNPNPDKSINNVDNEIIRTCMKYTGITKGIGIAIMSDVPAGAGLGGSSALTVGVLNALHAFKGEKITAKQLAQEACHIEIDILKSPIGVQDQYAAAYGGLRLYRFSKDGVTNEKLSVKRIIYNLVMFYTGVTRKANKILKVQNKNVSQNTEVLEILRDFALNSIGTIGKAGFGTMLDQNWQWKKKMANSISNPQIDKWYDKALKAGATGGKLLGAGGGGYFLFYCPTGVKEKVRRALKLEKFEFKLETEGSRIIYAD
jgi:D-glycero-alpha-D-manno-heptose-7-phosphate kinase